MRSYFRVILGEGNAFAADCLAGGFIGLDYGIHQDLTGDLPDDWRTFNKKFIPIFLAGHPGKEMIGAGLACGALWTVGKGLNEDDLVLSPDGTGHYLVGRVVGPYEYASNGPLQHRRPVQWETARIDRATMTDPLKKSAGSIGAVANLSRYADEIEKLTSGAPSVVSSTDPDIENVEVFVMEKHLEDFLIGNWPSTQLGKEYNLYQEPGSLAGQYQQYQTDTGPLDILAISKDGETLLVVELKKGRASDAVVGQTLRYMGSVKAALASPTQKVRGAIIALEDDLRIQRALSVVPDIAFYRYQIGFKLLKS
jgi:restriction system protein